MRLDSRFTTIALLVLCPVAASGQQRPAIRQLGAASAKSAEALVGVAGIRALPDGKVLVNDAGGRRVLLFDPQLASFTVVADSTSATANAYGGPFGNLVSYRGDSSLFVDPSSVSMLVLDGNGKVARVMAIPRAEDAGAIGGRMGNTAFDAAGRLVYRAGAGIRMMGGPGGGRVQMQAPSGAARPAMPQIPDPPDSAFIIGVNLATRKVDTLGYIRTPKIKLDIQQDERGFRAQSMVNPLPVVDDWAVTPDGAIAFVRGRDYHVDWVNPDGSKVTSAKIPFDWKRLTDEDKVAFIDSVKAARERLGPNAPMVAGGGPQAGGGGGAAPQMMVFSQTITGGGGNAPPPQTAQGGPGGGRAMQVVYVPASELPDYQPAFFAGSTRADAEGNLWIRTIPTTPVAGGPVYDVINRKGEIVERVQVPENRTILGFGPNGAVFLLNRDGTTTTLERASVR